MASVLIGFIVELWNVMNWQIKIYSLIMRPFQFFFYLHSGSRGNFFCEAKWFPTLS